MNLAQVPARADRRNGKDLVLRLDRRPGPEKAERPVSEPAKTGTGLTARHQPRCVTLTLHIVASRRGGAHDTVTDPGGILT